MAGRHHQPPVPGGGARSSGRGCGHRRAQRLALGTIDHQPLGDRNRARGLARILHLPARGEQRAKCPGPQARGVFRAAQGRNPALGVSVAVPGDGSHAGRRRLAHMEGGHAARIEMSPILLIARACPLKSPDQGGSAWWVFSVLKWKSYGRPGRLVGGRGAPAGGIPGAGTIALHRLWCRRGEGPRR